jgi:hypothetical protein
MYGTGTSTSTRRKSTTFATLQIQMIKVSAIFLFCFAVEVNLFNIRLHVASFSPTHILRKCAVPQTSWRHSNLLKLSKSGLLQQNYHSDNYFWSKERTENEIIQYCAGALFPHEEKSVARKRIQVISHELPLVVIHGFLPDDMCEEIIQAAKLTGDMKRSTLGEL